jgi:hypothetical protein
MRRAHNSEAVGYWTQHSEKLYVCAIPDMSRMEVQT